MIPTGQLPAQVLWFSARRMAVWLSFRPVNADPNGNYSGASFVVFGKTDGSKVELSAIEAGIGGFVMNGVSADDISGSSVSSAGDVDGDGLDDLIVGASNGDNSGASFVILGKTDGAPVELSAIKI